MNAFESPAAWVLLFFFCLASFFAWCWRTGLRNAKREAEYDKLYAKIYGLVYKSEITEYHYNRIAGLLVHLKALKYKNRERTNVIETAFLRRYVVIHDLIKKRECEKALLALRKSQKEKIEC